MPKKQPQPTLHEPCENCGIAYIKVSNRQCPHCALKAEVDILKRGNQALKLQVRSMEERLNSIEAMRGCLELMGPDDLLTLKLVLYAFREAPKATNILVAYRAVSDAPAGFVVEQRHKEEASGRARASTTRYDMTSIGGLALAGEYEAAARMYRTTQATAMLIRAAGHVMEVNSS